MLIARKVREHVRRFFNPDDFDPSSFRQMLMFGLIGLLLGEVMVYILLRRSAELGELPHHITDDLIIGISLVEFFAVPLISWLGSRRRRTVLVGWTAAALFCTVPLFALPDTDTFVDAGLCTTVTPLAFATGISAKAAVRLSMLLICGLVSALARAAYIVHGLAYLDEFNPSDNLHMHVGIFVLCRVMVYLAGLTFKNMALNLKWLQLLLIGIPHVITLVKLYRYAEAAPVARIQGGSGRGLFRSMGRVLGNRVAVLQILGMSLLAAAFWGFGMHEAAFVQVKYHVVPNYDSGIAIYIKVMSVGLGVILAGYIYTTPVMAKFDRKMAVSNVSTSCSRVALVYILMTFMLKCNRSGIGGLDDLKYIQPTCGHNCSCDRPWMQFTPVCVPEQMTTYFSPCHAGCATADTVNSVGVFSNCTCAPGGRVTIGACDDGSCEDQYFVHQMFFVIAALINTLAFAWQTTVMLESVDKRDVAVAVGLASAFVSLFTFVGAHGLYMGISSLAFAWQTTVMLESVDKRDVAVAVGLASAFVSLFTFVGAHGLYMGISSFTCAFARGSECLLQNDQFAPWVGCTSAVLASFALFLSVITYFVLRRQTETKEEELSL